MTNNKLQEMKKVADEKLQAEKDRLGSDRAEKKFQAEIDKARELVKNDFSAFDPYFAYGIFTQLALLKTGEIDDAHDAMKLAFERSILKTVTPGNQIEMMLVTQLITVHNTMINVGRLLAHSKSRDELELYGNMLNKLSRTFAIQTEALQRLRSGPEQKFNVSVSGQAVVGTFTHNTVNTDKAGDTKVPPAITDQSGTAMPIIQAGEESAAKVPRM